MAGTNNFKTSSFLEPAFLGVLLLLLGAGLSACLPKREDKAKPRGTNNASSDACRSSKTTPVNSVSKIENLPIGVGLRNGIEAKRSEYPAVGMLFFSDDKKTSICTGTLVCGDVVLTASHCFDGMPATGFSFHLSEKPLAEGKSTPENRDAAAKGTRVAIRDAKALAASVATGADIALLKLNKRILAPLASINLDRIRESSLQKERVALTLVGYGNNSGGSGEEQTGSGIKRHGQMRLVAHETSDTDPSKLLLGVLDPMSSESSVKSCHGDSGGPAFLGNDIYGVVAVSDKSCDAGTLTAVALMSENQAWLRSNLAEMCSRDVPTYVSKTIDTSVAPAINAEGDAAVEAEDCT